MSLETRIAALAAEVAGQFNKVAHEPFHIVDEKTAGTDGGGASADTVHTRTLNTVCYNIGGNVTLSSNQIEFASGKYVVDFGAPAQYVKRHQAYLYDIDNSEVVTPYGESGYTYNNSNVFVATYSRGQVHLSLSEATTFELRHWTEGARATYGLGVATNENTNIYSYVRGYRYST